MNREKLLSKLEKIHNLPTLPVVIDKLGAAVRDPDTDAKKIALIIEDDPAMMARILKVVNSAFYGVMEPIHSVQNAVARMGFTAVNNIAMSTAVFSTFGRQGETDFSREEFWRHSICCGIACNVLYERVRGNVKKHYSKDTLHLAGLLHDIGKIIFEQFFHPEFMQAVRKSSEQKVPLYQTEIETMGIDHSEVGAWLAAKWNLSAELTAVIRWHHDPAKAAQEMAPLANLAHIANYIVNLEKIGDGGDLAAPVFLQAIWKKMGLAVPDIAGLVDQVKEEAKHSEILLSFVK